jgi:hypothetical protein
MFIGTSHNIIFIEPTIIDFPVTLKKGGAAQTIDRFSISSNSELGILFDIAAGILADQENNGWFDEDNIMRRSDKHLTIRKHQPYPDVAVTLEKYNERTLEVLYFSFAWAGPDLAARAGKGDLLPDRYGSCTIKETCMSNFPPYFCQEQQGDYDVSQACTSSIMLPRTTKGKDCGEYKDGESWCIYDGITGFGFDAVGTRHYKQSCFDGEILTTECADYRQEVCTETVGRPLNAVCRPNRWEDCAQQRSKEACEDRHYRDCYWADYLAPEEYPYQSKQYKDALCMPHVPPGFKFWTFGSAETVCEMANELRHCDDEYCPQLWTDTNALYCIGMGDCGNGFNREGIRTTEGFKSSDRLEEPVVYTYGNQRIGVSLNLPLYEAQQKLITAQTYVNERANAETISADLLAFAKEAATWDECTFCDCIGGVVVGNCEFNQYIHGHTRCSLWQQPHTTDICETCGDSQKPCTEYWCKSLGACRFEMDEDGHGNCAPIPKNNEPILLQLAVPERTVTEAFFDKTRGWQIEEPYEAYTQLNISLESNVPVHCEVSLLPWIFDDPELSQEIPLLMMFFRGFALSYTQSLRSLDNTNQHYIYQRPIAPWNKLINHLREDFSLNNFLDIGILEQYHQRFVAIRTKFEKLVDNFAHYIDITHAREQIDDFYTKWLRFRPSMERAMLQLGDVLRALLISYDQGKTHVFFRCRDASGTLATTFVAYETNEDTAPPKIINQTWNNNTILLTLNEPSNCKYDTSDKSFETMQHAMNCTLFSFDPAATPFSCSAQTGGLIQEAFIRCRDNPPFLDHYLITSKTQDSYTTSQGISNTTVDYQGHFIVYEPRLLKSNITFLMPQSSTVTILFDEETACGQAGSVSENFGHYAQISCETNNNKYSCTLPVAADETYALACHAATGQERHEIQASITRGAQG